MSSGRSRSAQLSQYIELLQFEYKIKDTVGTNKSFAVKS
jgi:hypothetical protein